MNGGNSWTIAANLFRKRTPRPKITDGAKMVVQPARTHRRLSPGLGLLVLAGAVF